MSDEAREAELVAEARQAVERGVAAVEPPAGWNLVERLTDALESAFKRGVAEGIRQAREAVARGRATDIDPHDGFGNIYAGALDEALAAIDALGEENGHG